MPAPGIEPKFSGSGIPASIPEHFAQEHKHRAQEKQKHRAGENKPRRGEKRSIRRRKNTVQGNEGQQTPFAGKNTFR